MSNAVLQTQPQAQPAVPYRTQLDPAQEQAFQHWVNLYKIPWQDTPTADYDMRGFWKAMTAGDPRAVQSAQSGHYPDIWKTPYHHTFSNESIYAPPTAPHWVGNQLVDSSGRVLVDESVHKRQ